jgi:hypothetical protein
MPKRATLSVRSSEVKDKMIVSEHLEIKRAVLKIVFGKRTVLTTARQYSFRGGSDPSYSPDNSKGSFLAEQVFTALPTFKKGLKRINEQKNGKILIVMSEKPLRCLRIAKNFKERRGEGFDCNVLRKKAQNYSEGNINQEMEVKV